MDLHTFISRVREYRDRHGLTNAALAREAGLHVNTLRHLDTDEWRPRYDTLVALEKVMSRETA